MKRLFLVANWKSNKTSEEAREWIERITNCELRITNKEVIICPSFTLLQTIKDFIKREKLPFKIGAQNISPFDAGAYTGEINGKQIKEFADYVIIGHSERRTKFGETDEMLVKKAAQAFEAGLTPIFCIQNEDTPVPANVELVAYEPPTAIGTGNPDTPENAERVAKIVKERNPHIAYILYGGSVSAENIGSFVERENISGVLVGGASLDALKFATLIKSVSL